MKIEFRPEMKLIQWLLAKELKAVESLIRDKNIDWATFERMLRYHELAPHLYLSLRHHSGIMPQRVNNFLSNSYLHAVSDNFLKIREYKTIYNTFQNKGIKILPIKGLALLNDIYTDCHMRPMVDMDVLIREKDYKQSEGILISLGYEKKLKGLDEAYWRNKQSHIIFFRPQKRGHFTVELHWGLDFKRRGRILLPHIWDRLRKINLDKREEIELLSPEDNLFSLALHQRRLGKMLCLKYVVDVDCILRKYRDTFDWGYIIDTCKQEGLSSCLYFLLLQAKIFFDSDIFDTAMTKLCIPKVKNGLMKKFITAHIDSDVLMADYKDIYLKTHFLLYDTYIEPIVYIINIPLEQFAKFYNLRPYALKTKVLYRLRLIYFVFFGLSKILRFK